MKNSLDTGRLHSINFNNRGSKLFSLSFYFFIFVIFSLFSLGLVSAKLNINFKGDSPGGLQEQRNISLTSPRSSEYVPYVGAEYNVDLGIYNITADWGFMKINWSQIQNVPTSNLTNTEKNASGPYLYNDSTTIYFNETVLNDTIDDRAADTQKDAASPYLYNDSTTIYFNDTFANETYVTYIGGMKNLNLSGYNITADWFIGSINVTYNQTINVTNVTVQYLNVTNVTANYINVTNITVKNIVGGNITVNNITANLILGGNITVDNITAALGLIDNLTAINVTADNFYGGNFTGDWFFGKVNWSDIQNVPVSNLTNTEKNASGPYLYNDSTTIYFNGTVLNTTINQSIQNQVNGTYVPYNGGTQNLNLTGYNITANWFFGLINWSNIQNVPTANLTNTEKNASGPYLYNDSTTIYFNGTVLNQTINQSLADFAISFNQTRTVCKEGNCDYNVIQDAIDSITDASSSRRYVVLVYPGVYAETVVGEDYVSLKGMGTREEAEISGATGPLYTFPDYGGGVQNFKFTLNPTTNNQEVIDIPASRSQERAAIINNQFNVTFSSTNNIRVTMLDANGGNIRLEGNEIIYNATGSSTSNARTHVIVDADGTTLVDVIDNKIDIDIDDIDDRVKVYDDGTTTGTDTHIVTNVIYVNANNGSAYSGIVRAVNYVGTVEDLYLISNHIELTSNETGGSGIAHAIRTNSAGGGAQVKLIGNTIQVLGFNSNYWASVAAGDNVTSHFDRIDADDDWTGAGDMRYVSSFEPGYLSLTGNLTAENISANFGNFTNLYVSNETLQIGNVTLSSGFKDNKTYLNIPGVFINTTAYVGDGGFLSNISFEGGNISTNGTINAAEFYGGNFSGDIFIGNYAYFDNITANNVTANLYFGGNYTGDWFFGKINYSDIQNVPVANFTNTEKNASGPYLYNDSTTIYFNDTQLNKTIDAREIDTQKNASGPYLYNDSSTVYLNETKLNTTVRDIAEQYDNDTNTQKNASGPYLYNDSATIYFNETVLNNTIDDREIDTRMNTSGPYLYNNTSTIFFNGTVLNTTINQSIQNQVNGTYVPYVNGVANLVLSGYNITADFLFGTVNWSQITNVPFFLTGVVTGDPYLYLNGSQVGFNETKLNATITDLAGDTQKNTSGPYLYNNTTTIFFNDTLMNITIISIAQQYDNDTQKNASGPYLYNNTTTIFFNDTLLNYTIEDLAEVKAYTEEILVNVSGGTGSNTSATYVDFLITEVIVVPPAGTRYRFQAAEYNTGYIIDRNRRWHFGTWDIRKNHAIVNDTIQANITGAVTAGIYNVTIKYLDNFRP